MSHSGHDRPGLGLRQEINLDFDALSHAIATLHAQQRAADAEIDDLDGLPIRLVEGSNTGGPIYLIPTRALHFGTCHRGSQSKNRGQVACRGNPVSKVQTRCRFR